MTIAHLHSELKAFDDEARAALHTSDPAGSLRSSWARRFGFPMSTASAKSYVDYYRDMTRKSRRTHRKNGLMYGGSALGGAPLTYTTTPGANVAVYGRFPIDQTTDPTTINNLDVYFNSAISKDCGVANSSLSVPVEMGTNKVGGSRRRLRRRGTYKKQRNGRKSRRTNATRRGRKQRGAGFFDSLTMRFPPNFSTVFPNQAQSWGNQWSGATTPVPFPSNPEITRYSLMTSGNEQLIDPGKVSSIDSTFMKLASPPPWQPK